MFNECLQRNLKAVGLFKSKNSYSWEAERVLTSGITEQEVKQIDANKEEITALKLQISALMELLNVTEEHVKESDVLVKGSKKVAVKK